MGALRKSFIVTVLFLGATGHSLSTGQDKKDAKKNDNAATVIFEVYKDKAGEFRFRLKADDHSLAISSHGYKTIDEAERVIHHIKTEAAKAKIVNHTKAK
jgi:uncharacterized protein YegP (UPF0339 family)